MSTIPDDILAKARKALDKAKIELMSSPNSAFISTVCFSMKCLWRDDLPTAATNGRAIWFNPYAYLALSPGKQLSRLLHETWHPALLHLDRVGSRDPKVWNMACDYFINLMLTDAGYEKIDTWLHDPQFRHMSADEIYKYLMDNQPEGGFPDFDEQDMDPPKDEPERIELQCHMDQVLIRAVMHSKMAGDAPGSVPGEVETYLDKLMNPILPWNRILLKHMHGLNKTDYSWKRPNRRFFPEHHLPSLYGDALDEIAAFVDISGSVSDQDFNQTVSEVHQVIKQFKPRLLHFGQFDTEIKSVRKINTVRELLNTPFTGRGGTLIRPVIEWIKEHKPKLTLIFTDGGFRMYPDDPGTPVIWLIHNNPNWTAPYGKVIHYEM
jgi:predicted metal-dependent peptidase